MLLIAELQELRTGKDPPILPTQRFLYPDFVSNACPLAAILIFAQCSLAMLVAAGHSDALDEVALAREKEEYVGEHAEDAGGHQQVRLAGAVLVVESIQGRCEGARDGGFR